MVTGYGLFRTDACMQAQMVRNRVREGDRWNPGSGTCSARGTVKFALPLSERTYRHAVCRLEANRNLQAYRTGRSPVARKTASVLPLDTGSGRLWSKCPRRGDYRPAGVDAPQPRPSRVSRAFPNRGIPHSRLRDCGPRWRLDKTIQPSAPSLKPSHGTDSSPVNSCQAPASPAFPILAQGYRPAWFNSSCSARKRWWRSRNSAMKSIHAGSRAICRYRSRIVVR